MQVREINRVISLAQTEVRSQGDALECSLQGCRRGEPVGKGGRFGLTQWTDLLTGVASSSIIMGQSKR